jgi:UDP-N-acetylmuramate dehydrogenase
MPSSTPFIKRIERIHSIWHVQKSSAIELKMSEPCLIERDKLLSAYSTFKIGGPARLFCEVDTVDKIQEVLAYCRAHALRYLIIGKGSNCLFDDRGYDGLVILNKIAFCQLDYPVVSVGAGYSFSLLGVQTARNGWSGLEFASGIPGSVGGAIYMNAGAGGAETKDILAEVSFIDEAGSLRTLTREQVAFANRFSTFQQKPWAIISGKFRLHPLPEARKKQLEIVAYRTRTQPYGEKSAGCVFCNPPGHSSGALIQKCGLKGKRVGGAEVSPVHANFIVNAENAKAQDVLQLAHFVKNAVQEQTGISLEMEIRYIPYT